MTPERPWADSRFWLVQLVLVGLTLAELAVVVSGHLSAVSPVNEYATLVLLLPAVVYAASRFGLAGGVATAWVATLLAAPRFVAAGNAGSLSVAWVEVVEVVVVNVAAVAVGQRTSARRDAAALAAEARRAHEQVEARYRELFDSNQSPILIVDGDGVVVDANPSASRLFPAVQAQGATTARPRLVDVIGADGAAYVLSLLVSRPGTPSVGTRGDEPVAPLALDAAGARVLMRPAVTPVGAPGERRLQVVFDDVTAELDRQARMEAFAARVVLGQEEERRHLAQELHDGPLQSLIHLCRQIDEHQAHRAPADGERRGTDAAEGSGPDDGENAALPLTDVRATAELVVAELRGIAKGLRPSILDDLGLEASISQLLTEAGTRAGLETTLGVTGTATRLPPPVELALFRIAQEALSNAERHARATRVAVGLEFDPGGVRLLVTDDGCGFEPGAPALRGGGSSLGVPGMAERAALVGATFTIHSAPGAGTTVDVRVPTRALRGGVKPHETSQKPPGHH